MNQAVHTQWTLHCGFSPAVVYTFLLLCVAEDQTTGYLGA